MSGWIILKIRSKEWCKYTTTHLYNLLQRVDINTYRGYTGKLFLDIAATKTCLKPYCLIGTTCVMFVFYLFYTFPNNT